MKKFILEHSLLILVIAVAFYTVGACFIPKNNIDQLQKRGIAYQNEYTYTDSEGEEHDGTSLINIKGIGKILTYNDVYLSPVLLLIPALIIGTLLFGKGKEIESITFANCILGIQLIDMTNKEAVISTIMFWLGIVTSYIYIKIDRRDKKDSGRYKLFGT